MNGHSQQAIDYFERQDAALAAELELTLKEYRIYEELQHRRSEPLCQTCNDFGEIGTGHPDDLRICPDCGPESPDAEVPY